MKITLYEPTQDELERTAQSQREFTRRLANKIGRGEEPLIPLEVSWARGVLRAWNDALADTIEIGSDPLPEVERAWLSAVIFEWADNIHAPKRGKGNPNRKLPHPSLLAVEWAMLREHQGRRHTAAVFELAERYGVDDKAVRNKLKGKDDSGRAYTEIAIEWIQSIPIRPK